MIRLLEPVPMSRQSDVVAELDQTSRVGRNFVLLVLLSCVIATFGLVENSPAVIIGAMLIAPLMSSIVGFALALVLGDPNRAGRALLTLVVGVVLAVLVSAALGQLVSASRFNFLEQLPDEIISRTRPSLFDLAIALAGGAAAAYALARPELSATLPGVAIATALMPPVCVVGIGLALGRSDVASGAFLLFLTNFVAIAFASSVVFVGVGFRPIGLAKGSWAGSRGLLLSGLLLLAVIIPLAGFMYRIAQDAWVNTTIQATLATQLAAIPDSNLVSFDLSRPQDNTLSIVATIRSPRELTFDEAVGMERAVATHLQQTVALKVLVVPEQTLDPLVPPTPVPTPPPGATVVPTTTPVPLPTQTSTPIPTTTATFTPTPTASRTTTPTSTATATSTRFPTATAVAYAVVGATGGQGAYFRLAPGLKAAIAALPDGTLVQLTGAQNDADGYLWAQIITPDGRVGWIATNYLVPYRAYAPPS
jgi:uncharacterized hydrophobic protein (TIGR00271 family)